MTTSVKPLMLETRIDVSLEPIAPFATVLPERYAWYIALRQIWLTDCPAWRPSWWMLRRNRFAIAVALVGVCVSIVPPYWPSVATHCSNGTTCGCGSEPGTSAVVMVGSSPGRVMKIC